MSDIEEFKLPEVHKGYKPLILVVDDLPENIAVLSAMVRKDGADVRVANSGEVALRYARLEPQPDLILLDIMMPVMDGYAVLAELNKDELTRNIPVIMVTSLDDPGHEQRGLDSGAADYIAKPINSQVLRARVRSQLELKRSRDLLAGQKQWLESEVQRRVSENTHLQARLELALAATNLGVWEFDFVAGKYSWSDVLRQLLGIEALVEGLAGFLERIHPEDRTKAERCLALMQTDDSVIHNECRIHHPDGHWLWVEGRGRVIRRDSTGLPLLAVGTMSDVTERVAAEADRQLSSTVFQGISDGVCITDGKARIIKVNDAFCHVTGYAREDVIGQKPNILKSGSHPPAFYREMWEKIALQGGWQGEITNRRQDGSLISEWLSISAVKNSESVVTNYVGMFSDLSERREAAERIQFLSSYDGLTGLPNRNLFADRLEQSLITSRRFERGTAVILLDLDRFRVVNDTLGPPIGDEVLVEVGRRLSLQVREGDTVGRRGGNEFGFVMANLGHERDAIALAQRILDAINVPYEIKGQSVVLTASIGISVAPTNGDTGQELLKSADVALVRAKSAGRNTFRFYSPDMDADAARRMGLELALRDALKNNELSVHYQPQISLDSGSMIGMEALLRWNNEQFGSVSPVEFIPVAEETGLIIPIGEWVLRTACQQTKAWLDLGLMSLRVAVNLSARQFRQPNLPALVQEVLAQSKLPAAALELEITESVLNNP